MPVRGVVLVSVSAPRFSNDVTRPASAETAWTLPSESTVVTAPGTSEILASASSVLMGAGWSACCAHTLPLGASVTAIVPPRTSVVIPR